MPEYFCRALVEHFDQVAYFNHAEYFNRTALPGRLPNESHSGAVCTPYRETAKM